MHAALFCNLFQMLKAPLKKTAALCTGKSIEVQQEYARDQAHCCLHSYLGLEFFG
jgi:hypothetical protein